MGNRKEIELSIRNRVISLRKENKSYSEIAKMVELSRATVQTIVRNYNNTNSTETKARSGRPKKLSGSDISRIIKVVNKDPKISAWKLAEHLGKQSNVIVHPRTIRNALHDNGFKTHKLGHHSRGGWITTSPTEDGESLHSPCGSICVYDLLEKLIFNCEFCDLKYGDLDNFRRHLHEAHNLYLSAKSDEENAQNSPETTSIFSVVKKEPVEPPLDLPTSYFTEPLVSCGNIFIHNQRSILLACGYCNCSKYENVEMFEKHIRQQHNMMKGCHNKLSVFPKVENIKEEVFIITEIAEATEIKEELMHTGDQAFEGTQIKDEF